MRCRPVQDAACGDRLLSQGIKKNLWRKIRGRRRRARERGAKRLGIREIHGERSRRLRVSEGKKTNFCIDALCRKGRCATGKGPQKRETQTDRVRSENEGDGIKTYASRDRTVASLSTFVRTEEPVLRTDECSKGKRESQRERKRQESSHNFGDLWRKKVPKLIYQSFMPIWQPLALVKGPSNYLL